MKVKVVTGSFDDRSRGRYGIKTYEASIVLEGVTLFQRHYQENIPYESGYADRGRCVRNAAAAKQAVVEDFREFLERNGR